MSIDNKKLRSLPKVDELLKREDVEELIETHPRDLVVDAGRDVIHALRQRILEGQTDVDCSEESIVEEIRTILKAGERRNLRRVINGTGVILHTNLGRARINETISKAIGQVAMQYCNLEYDLEKGERGSRHDHVSGLASKLLGTEDAIIVNNNAAAVTLCLSAIARGKEVIVSRGELVEIGGAFRVPEIMEQSGCKLVEIGTTNKTKLSDYENAITDQTAAILKVHTSNYRVIGFTEAVDEADLVQLGKRYDIPVLYDLGSGLMMDLNSYGVDEPTVQSAIKNDVDVLLFSGDKLLGGPQAGIAVGKKSYIKKMKKHPLARMVRSDKLTLAGLEEVFRLYFDPERARTEIPVLDMITMSQEEVKEKALRLQELITFHSIGFSTKIVPVKSQIGGGSAPMLDLDSYALCIEPSEMKVAELEERLRHCEIPVIGRIMKEKYYLDLRTIDESEFEIIKNVFLAIFKDE